MRFGFIGAGNMASAIIRGMNINTKSYDGKDIFITSKSGTSAQRLAETCGATAVTTAAEVVAASDVLVLAVKPHILAAVLPAFQFCWVGDSMCLYTWNWQFGVNTL